jgi:serine phosphatase RsbU (regulator of sigma subunit)
VADRRRHGTPITFATICLVTIHADQASASVLLAGHPPPILIASGVVEECRVAPANPAIGVLESAQWQSQRVGLPAPPWTMVLYTDGLVEGRTSPGGPRPFGVERLIDLLALRAAPITEPDADAVIATIREANGGPLADDMVFLAASPRT